MRHTFKTRFSQSIWVKRIWLWRLSRAGISHFEFAIMRRLSTLSIVSDRVEWQNIVYKFQRVRTSYVFGEAQHSSHKKSQNSRTA